MTTAWREFLFELPHAFVPVKCKGDGPNSLICLHGYMQNKDLFDSIFPEIPDGWRVICIDLPLFGQSKWKSPNGIDGTFFESLWNELIQTFSSDKWHILGFSMGGKVSMLMCQFAPIEVSSAFLVAPDGIKMNYWHELVVKSKVGATLFNWALSYPDLLLAIGGGLFKLRLLSGFSNRFLRGTFKRPQDRELLKRTIEVYHSFPFRFKEWADNQIGKSTKWHLIWGKRDKVLKPKVANLFTKKFPDATVHLVNGGHMLITHNHVRLRKIIDRNLFNPR